MGRSSQLLNWWTTRAKKKPRKPRASGPKEVRRRKRQSRRQRRPPQRRKRKKAEARNKKDSVGQLRSAAIADIGAVALSRTRVDPTSQIAAERQSGVSNVDRSQEGDERPSRAEIPG